MKTIKLDDYAKEDTGFPKDIGEKNRHFDFPGVEIRLKNTQSGCDIWHVGIVAEGGEGRRVMHGPLVPGPWGYMVQTCSVIDGTSFESKHPSVIDCKPGDLLEFEGVTYEISVDNRRYAHLTVKG